MLRLQLRAFFIVVFLLSSLAAVRAAEYLSTLLEAPPGGGYVAITIPTAINDRGQIAGFYAYQVSPGGHGFVYDEGEWISFDVPDSSLPWVASINKQGQIVGYYYDSQGMAHGFLYDQGVVTSFDVPLASHTGAYSINDNGQIAGSYVDSQGTDHGFLYEEGEWTSFDIPGTIVSGWFPPIKINNQGQIAGSYVKSDGTSHGFLYEQGIVTLLDVPGASRTVISSMNDQGQLAGSYTDSLGEHQFLYEEGEWTSFDPPGSYASATGINNYGQIAGIYSPSNYYEPIHLFLYDEGAITTFDTNLPCHFFFGTPAVINNRSQISGICEGSGYLYGFLATPSMELATLSPATLWIGLKNSKDQGTAFDLRVEAYLNDKLVAAGQTLCLMGVTRNPEQAMAVTVPFDPFTPVGIVSDATLSLNVLTRIGTNANGTQCSRHSNAVGLRLYYDAEPRPSQLGMELTPDPLENLFLHSDSSGNYLDATAPTAATAQFKNSPALNFKKGNPWKAIGTWSLVLP